MRTRCWVCKKSRDTDLNWPCPYCWDSLEDIIGWVGVMIFIVFMVYLIVKII